MNEQSTIDAAVKRLALALDALDAAVERRRDSDRDEETLSQQLHDLGTDRSRLAAALDGETSRARRLEATNREIADTLSISVKTVDTHRGHVLKKLRLRNNSDITRFAISNGLIPV